MEVSALDVAEIAQACPKGFVDGLVGRRRLETEVADPGQLSRALGCDVPAGSAAA